MTDELDIVELSEDIESRGLKKGDKGTIVHIYGDSKTFEVEFDKGVFTILHSQLI